MRYLCTQCNYIYDETQGEEDFDQGTSFDELGDYFTCPVCGAEKEEFHGIEEEINYIPEDPRDPLEIDHFIETQVIGDKLKVTIGNEIHPMGDSHRIAAMSLYDEYGDLIETKFMEQDIDPVVEFDLMTYENMKLEYNVVYIELGGKNLFNNCLLKYSMLDLHYYYS